MTDLEFLSKRKFSFLIEFLNSCFWRTSDVDLNSL